MSAEFPLDTFFAALSVIWGACIGSFLNVCIYRIPRELSIVAPRSYCPACKRSIPWYLNIPLLSYPALRGRCAFCKARITPRYFLVELLVAALFLLVWLKLDPFLGERPLGLSPMAGWPLVPAYWLAVSGLVLGTFVNFEHLIIPDRVTLGGIVAGVALSGILPELQGESDWMGGLLGSLIGAALGWGLLWMIAIAGRMAFRREAMGFGDVKLLGAIGAFLGWRAVLFSIVASSLAGSLAGVTLVLFGRKGMQSKIPYGPYLALAAAVWIFWGPTLWDAYIRLILPAQAYPYAP